jgi:hypothetical protein
LALALTLPGVAHAAVRVYPIDEIRPGLKVQAHTVFEGTAVDSFPLEVLGVAREGRATGDLILARATDPRLDHMGIVAGMSGSPVYAADGRLLGALAYGWGFSKDPICGIEPAQDMVRIWSLPDQPPPGDFDGGGSTPAAAGAKSGSSSLPSLRTPLAVSGLTPEALKLLQPWADDHGFMLTPGGATGPATMSAGGGAAQGHGKRPRLEPGDAVAVDVLRGDAGLSAIGTVTAVDGDKILAFGHPFFFNGPTRLPISTAEITAVLPSLESSFKIGHPVTAVGTLTQDRRAGIAGVLGEPPPMLPVTVRVSGLGATADTFHYEAARQRQLVPTALQVATVNSMLSRGGLPSEGTLRWKLTARFRAPGGAARTLAMDDLSTGGEAMSAVNDMITPVSDLLDNSWTPVDVEQLDYDIQIEPRAEALTVKSVQLDRPRARPGETVRATVELESYRGGTETQTLSFRVPDTMPAQMLVLYIGGGNDWARFDANAAPGRYGAHSLDELVDRLQKWPRSSCLYLAAYGANREVTIRGRDYPDLPKSTQVVLTQPDVKDLTSRWGRASLLTQSSREMDRYVSGGAAVQLEVTPKALTPSVRSGTRQAPPEEEDRDDTED